MRTLACQNPEPHKAHGWGEPSALQRCVGRGDPYLRGFVGSGDDPEWVEHEGYPVDLLGDWSYRVVVKDRRDFAIAT